MNACSLQAHVIGSVDRKGELYDRMGALDEICIDGSSVIWYKSMGKCIHKSFQYDTTVIDVRFTFFDEIDGIVLCVLSNPERIHVYSNSGSMYEISLPFRAEKLFSLKNGILIQRAHVPSNEIGPPHPVLFSLSHPLEEIRPVAVQFIMENSEFLTDQREVIRYTHADSRLVLSKHLDTQQFTLWHVRQQDISSLSHSYYYKPTNTTWSSKRPDLRLSTMDRSSIMTSTVIEHEAEYGQPISAEYVLVQVWTSERQSKEENCDQDQAFFGTDMDGYRIFCIYDAAHEQVLIQQINCENDDVSVGSTNRISCKMAIPLGEQMILLKSNDQLMLHRGATEICAWVVKDISPSRFLMSPMLPETPLALRTPMSPISLSPYDQSVNTPTHSFEFKTPSRTSGQTRLIQRIEAVDDTKVDVFMHNRVVRYQISLQAESSVVESILCTFDVLLPKRLAIQIRVDVSRISQLNEAMSGLESDREWSALVHILSCCGMIQEQQKEDKKSASWTQLIESDFHQEMMQKNAFMMPVERTGKMGHIRCLTLVKRADLVEHFHLLFMGMHLVYEEYKLRIAGSTDTMLRLLPVLVNFASSFNHVATVYLDFYSRDFGRSLVESHQNTLFSPISIDSIPFNRKSVPSIFRWMAQTIASTTGCPIDSFPQLIKAPCKTHLFGFRTHLICRLYTEPSVNIAQALVDENVTLAELDDIPFGVAMPIRQALFECRANPPLNLSSDAYKLVGREDLSKLTQSQHDFDFSHQKLVGKTKDDDGLLLVEAISAQRFGRDRRMKEVCRLLRSSRPMSLRMKEKPELSDHERGAERQANLLQLCKRALGLAVGRGMLTMSTLHVQHTEVLPIPTISLQGRIPPNSSTITLDQTNLATDFGNWAEFHNGVAAGLRLIPKMEKISRTWIVYNKQKTSSLSHAGVLLALGLKGYLSELAMTDVFEYLSQGNSATTIGILLGMAASKLGTMDRAVSKMLCLHIPSLLPAPFAEIEVAASSQIAALIGIGLLYIGTGHRLMTELLLAELGRRESSGHYESRDSYVLSAGLALGLISLGRGSDVGLSDLKIEDRLNQLMTGGKYPKQDASSSTKCSRLREGDYINVQMTAPGATLALGFMFMKTNKASVAARLEVPDTLFLLDYVQPDLMLLRVLAKNLVLWDKIEPTISWVESQLPSVVKDLYQNPPADIEYQHQTIVHAHANILAGACFSLGLRYAGTASEAAKKVLMHFIEHFSTMRNRERFVIETCLDVVAQSLGLVMAGTGELETLRVLRQLRMRSDTEIKYGQHMALNSAIGMVFLGAGHLSFKQTKQAIAVLVIALYPKFPITPMDTVYHLQALRHLYTLATEARYIQAIDVDTNQPCYVPISIHHGIVSHTSTPCVVPSFSSIERIRTETPRYYSLDLSKDDSSVFQNIATHGKLYVKRKSGNLSYGEDAHGLRSLMARAFPKEEQGLPSFLSCFTEDPNYVVFGEYYGSAFTFCTSILYECLAREKPEMLMTYLAMHHAIQFVPSNLNSFSIANLQLLIRYSKHHRGSSEFLIQTGFIESCVDRLHQYFFNRFEGELSEYLKTGKWSDDMLFACFLTYLDAPLPIGVSSFSLSDVLSLSMKSTFTPASTWIQTALLMEKGEYY